MWSRLLQLYESNYEPESVFQGNFITVIDYVQTYIAYCMDMLEKKDVGRIDRIYYISIM